MQRPRQHIRRTGHNCYNRHDCDNRDSERVGAPAARDAADIGRRTAGVGRRVAELALAER